MDQDPLFLVFLGLHKSYNTVYRRSFLTALYGYGAIPRMCILMAMFWGQQEVVTRQNGYHGPTFKATQVTTQDGLIFPTMFNLIASNVVRKCILMRVSDQEVTHKGLIIVVGRFLGLLYADNSMVGSQDP